MAVYEAYSIMKIKFFSLFCYVMEIITCAFLAVMAYHEIILVFVEN